MLLSSERPKLTSSSVVGQGLRVYSVTLPTVFRRVHAPCCIAYNLMAVPMAILRAPSLSLSLSLSRSPAIFLLILF